MASSALSTRRLTTSSSPLASTPPVTTTTTTTTTTGTLSASDPRQQRQFPSSQSPMAALTDMNTSNDAPGPLYSEDGELPEEVLSYFEHWASPTEVLQLRALCSDIVSKYKNEAARLLRELEEVKRGRDALQREVQETERLRQLYSKADTEYEKARRERSQWSEERELLRLRLQRLSVENQRLQQIVARQFHCSNPNQPRGSAATAPLTLDAGSGAAFTSTTTPLFTGSSIPTPSASSSSVARQAQGGCAAQRQKPSQHPGDHEVAGGANNSSGMGDDYYYSGSNHQNNNNNSSSGDINGALQEQLRLIEELHRCSTEYAELDLRFQFAQTLWEITAARGEQRSMLLVAENEKLKGQLRHWRTVAEDNAGRLDATTAQLRDCCNDVEEARRALQAAHEERQTAVASERSAAEESMASIRAAHAEELARVQQQLQVALDDSARTREKLQGALDAAQRRADAQREELLADVDAAQQKYGNALRIQGELEAALAEATTQHEQQRAQMEHELRLLRSAQEAALKKWDDQSTVLAKTQDENTGLTARLLEVEEELQTANAQLGAALEKLKHAGDLEDALINARARAEEAELEVQTQQSYYAEQLRVHQTALSELQRQRDDEVERLGRAVERLQRRYASNKLRLAAAVKGIGRAAETGPMPPPQTTCGEEEQAAARPSAAGRIPLAEESPGPDAVMLLQQSTAIVATLARTLHRETHVA